MNRAHTAVAVTFLTFGLGIGLWSGASAFVLARSGVTPGGFGVALTLYMVAYLGAMTSGGALARHVPLKRMIIAALLTLGLLYALLLACTTELAVFIVLGTVGCVAGLLDLTMNAEGTLVEAQLRRPVLAGLHGAAAAGGAAGSIIGSLVALRFGTLPLGLIALCGHLAAAMLVMRLTPLRALSLPPNPGQRSGAAFSRPLVILGLVLGVSMAGENAATMWGSSLLTRDAPALAAFAGAGTTFFLLCQACMRFGADWLRARFSDRLLMTVSLLVAACGFALIALHLNFAASVLGFAVIGLGTGMIVPCGFALSVATSRLPAASALSVVNLVAGLPRLPTPLVMGAIAAQVSLAGAFGIFTLLFGAAFVLLALTLRPPSPAPPAPATLEKTVP